MTKLCSVCSTENRDDAQFCRACGTPFPVAEAAAAEPTEEERLAAGITCDECSFHNEPGIRYCANCGVNLLGTVIVPRARAATGTASPPPISYPSFATVAPYPPAHIPQTTSADPLAGFGAADAPSSVAPSGYEPSYDAPRYDAPVDEAPLYDPLEGAAPLTDADSDAPYAAPDHEATEPAAAATPAFADPAPNRTPLLIGAALLMLAAVGAGAWWFMGSSARNAASPSAAASAASAVQPAAVALPASQAETVVLPVAPVATPAVAAPAVATAASEAAAALPPPPLVGPGETVLVPAGSATLKGSSPASPFEALPSESAASQAEAKRLAAEKRREKVAKDKADREAKLKLAADQQASAARADQEAQARRRAEEMQRPRPAVTQPVAPPPPPVQARGVREICAGRGTIAEAVCQSRECGAAEHANEAVCREVREREDRRRNYNN